MQWDEKRPLLPFARTIVCRMLPMEYADGKRKLSAGKRHALQKSCARLAGLMRESAMAVTARDCVPAAAEARANCRRIVAATAGVQCRRWRHKICGHKVPGSCTPQIESTSGVTATDIAVPVACTATEWVYCSGVTATGIAVHAGDDMDHRNGVPVSDAQPQERYSGDTWTTKRVPGVMRTTGTLSGIAPTTETVPSTMPATESANQEHYHHRMTTGFAWATGTEFSGRRVTRLV